ncbi:hypothetical protein ACFLIM_31925 [Nonomuraea sp. M3C6]|uniref:Uncharacterized protein n=1 Tax=Nonomuraea marmarensis TaxID=3351344 RepID=A0ABW7AKD2_9ACTN
MAEEKSRNRRRININDAGIERRRAAIEAIVDQPPPPKAEDREPGGSGVVPYSVVEQA